MPFSLAWNRLVRPAIGDHLKTVVKINMGIQVRRREISISVSYPIRRGRCPVARGNQSPLRRLRSPSDLDSHVIDAVNSGDIRIVRWPTPDGKMNPAALKREMAIRQVCLPLSLGDGIKAVFNLNWQNSRPHFDTLPEHLHLKHFKEIPGDTDEEQRQNALRLVKKLKACIICPSTRAADGWPGEIPRFDGSQGQQEIDAFRAAPAPSKLILVARYDGVDLPGDSCRVLALDGIPTGSSLLERFIDQGLKIEKLRASHTATRIVQAIGRIFRSNTDHGVVLVCGTDLRAWLQDPNNQKFMPKLLQQQILLGLELRRMVDNKKATYEELIEGVLRGRKDWDDLYNGVIAEFETSSPAEEPQWFVEIIAKEREAYQRLWIANGPLANTKYSAVAAEAESNGEPRLAAWLRHWQGLSLLLAGQDATATVAFVQAANERVELGRPEVKGGVLDTLGDVMPGRQAKKISGHYKKNKGKILQKLEKILADLKYGPDTKPTEQALCDLGQALGLEGSRPDNETRTGPDVLWLVPEIHQGAALEAKTNKQPNNQYTKTDDIGQIHDHVNWLQKNFPKESFLKAIVGRKLSVAKESNPEPDLRVIPLEQFVGLTLRLQEAIKFIESTAGESDLEICVERALQEFGLLWPMCVESLESILATDLKNSDKLPRSEE